METELKIPLLNAYEVEERRQHYPRHVAKLMLLAILQLAFLTAYTAALFAVFNASGRTQCADIALLYCKVHQPLLMDLT